jgi:hypothetical protein
MAAPALPTLPKKPFWVPWFLDPPEWELETQIQEYRTLPWYRSYRKISAVLVLFWAGFRLFFAVMLRLDVAALLVALAVYVGLAIFVVRGVRISMMAAMVLFTLDRIAAIASSFVNPLVWGFSLAWWLYFTERFWKAFRVEQLREALARNPAGPEQSAP